MLCFTKTTVLDSKTTVLSHINSGHVFCYPTDTIYGLGCDATNQASVDRIRSIKKRNESPFSVIVPSLEWVKSHCLVTSAASEWIKKLPGPYTLILPLRPGFSLGPAVHGSTAALGIRIPDHWFTPIIQESRRPFITTSVNVHKYPHLTDPRALSEAMRQNIDILIEDGPLPSTASTIVDLTASKPRILTR